MFLTLSIITFHIKKELLKLLLFGVVGFLLLLLYWQLVL